MIDPRVLVINLGPSFHPLSSTLILAYHWVEITDFLTYFKPRCYKYIMLGVLFFPPPELRYGGEALQREELWVFGKLSSNQGLSSILFVIFLLITQFYIQVTNFFIRYFIKELPSLSLYLSLKRELSNSRYEPPPPPSEVLLSPCVVFLGEDGFPSFPFLMFL